MTARAVAPTAPPNDLPADRLRLRPDPDGRLSVDPAAAGWRYLSLDIVPVGRAPQPLPGRVGEECAVVVIGGRDVRVTSRHVDEVRMEGRAGPFDGLPWAVWLPSAEGLTVSAAEDGVVALARAPRSDRSGVAGDPIVITPADVRIEVRGAGSATRQINHIVAPEFPADRLLLVEVLTPSGNWSSWPPHKHDVDDMPAEAVLEETYHYRFRRPEAWAIQRLYRRPERGLPSRDATWVVRDGEVVLVTDGYHPFVATHGDDAWYLNALAGDRRTMACSFDPDLDHVRAEWASMAPDPRVPLVPG